jgi:hypothetical protein
VELTREELKTAYPKLFEEITAEAFAQGLAQGQEKGRAEGMALGKQEERRRIMDVEAQGMPDHVGLIQTLKYDGKTTGAEAALQVLTAHRALLSSRHEQFVQGGPPLVGAPDPHIQSENLSSAERAKRDWEASAELRQEFRCGGFPAYLAQLKNERRIF